MNATIAVNCWLVPSPIVGVAVMVKPLGWAPVTVSEDGIDASTEPKTVEIDGVPAAMPEANPAPVPKSSMVAANGSDEFHSTSEVMSCCVLSVKVAVALNGSVVPGAMLALVGVIAIALAPTLFTCSAGVVALTPWREAVKVALPARFAVASPDEETRIAEEEDFQETAFVRSCGLPTVNVPVAFSCIVVPTASFVNGVVIVIAETVAALTLNLLVAVVDPNLAVIVVVPAARVVVFPALGFAATEVLLEVQWMPGADVRS